MLGGNNEEATVDDKPNHKMKDLLWGDVEIIMDTSRLTTHGLENRHT